MHLYIKGPKNLKKSTRKVKKMKKFIICFLMLFCLLPTQVLAQEIPVFNANGQKLPLTPSAYTENDVTMLPLRAVAEYLEADVNWQANGTINISKEDCQIALTVGNKNATITTGNNQKTLSLSKPPLYKDNTLFVPMRFIAEAFDMPVNYCVNHQDNIKYPAVFLGESKYAEKYNFEELINKNEKIDFVNPLQQELFNNGIYDYNEINLIYSIFVRKVMGMYAETHNIPQSFGELSQQINNYYALYISNKVLSSSEWQKYLALANHQCRELDITPLEISVKEDKISGTFGFELFSGFLFIPLLADVEITRCNDEVKTLILYNSFHSYSPNNENATLETDSSGHMWRITDVSNVRSYINLQALRDNEPEIYEIWLASKFIHFN